MADHIMNDVCAMDTDGSKMPYQRPEISELDASDTAVGVVVGGPENVSYIS